MSKYTKELLEPIVKKFFTITDVCRELGLVPVGGNCGYVKTLIKKYSLDISHFKGSGHNKGKSSNKKKSSSEILVNNGKPQHGWKLKRALIEAGHVEKCAGCSIAPIWNGSSLTLEVDHVDGNRTNHLENNLRFLCPNCHSQTSTYAGRNKK